MIETAARTFGRAAVLCLNRVRDGVTGLVVDRMPLGRQCVVNDSDQVALDFYLDAIARVQNLNRHAVRATAKQEFNSDAIVEGAIVEGAIAALYLLRATDLCPGFLMCFVGSEPQHGPTERLSRH
jgi:hypothetical protein